MVRRRFRGRKRGGIWNEAEAGCGPFRGICTKTQIAMLKNKGFVNIYFEFLVDNLEKLRIILTCMDMKKECMIPESGHLPDLTGNRLLVGSKQLRKALKAGTVLTVFLARGADPGVTEPIAALCEAADIQLIWVSSKKELGQACGIDVGAAAAAILKP